MCECLEKFYLLILNEEEKIAQNSYKAQNS